jgi:hypothetical protein
MSFIKEQRINNAVVLPVPIDPQTKEDMKPIRGMELLPELYCNVFMLAKKHSGKSTLVYKIVKDCSDPRTHVIAFVSTVHKDKTYLQLKRYCKSKNIEFTGHTSIIDDDGKNILQELVTNLQNQIPEEENEDDQSKTKSIILCDSDDEDEKPKRRYKYRVPQYIIILDDLSTELTNPAIVSLIKKNRHFFSKIIISNQYFNDLGKSGRKNIDFFLIFGSQPKDKLQEIWKEIDLSTPFDKFYELYKYSTEDRFNFLYVDVVQEKFRKNFNIELKIS